MFKFCGGGLCSSQQERLEIKFETVRPRGGFEQPERIGYTSLSDISEEVKVDKIVKSKFDQYLQSSRISNKQFVDNEFPPNSKSLGDVQLMSGRTVEWKRIGDIIDNPKLLQFIDSKQVVQSNSGDCYFLSSIATLAENHARIRSLFGQIQINKSGLYMVRVNVKGVQKQVVIDDYFPVYSHNKQFVYSKPIFNEDIWVMLLEKVWAKINGSYSKIVLGYPHQVLTTFTNAPCFYLKLDSIEDKNSIWQSLKEAKRESYPVCCSSKTTNVPSGIMQSATYALANCFQLQVEGASHRILALINPWEQNQYNGKYSQKDLNFWNKLSSNSSVSMVDRQGIIMIGFNDFLNYFESLDISHIHSYYNYNFDVVSTPPNHGKYFSINVKEATECYFVVQQQRRYKNSQSQQIIFSRMTLVVGRWDNEKKTHYYVDSKMQHYLPTLSARCLVLQPGNYVAYAKCEWLDGLNNQLTFATYSSKRILIQQIPKTNLIKDVFIDHSLTRGQRTYLDQNSFISFQLLYNQGGYAYLSANPTTNRKILLQFSKKDLQSSGFKLKYPKTNETNIKLMATSTQPQIIICRILPNAESITFPLPIKISQSL